MTRSDVTFGLQDRIGSALAGETTMLASSTQQSDLDDATTHSVPISGAGTYRSTWHPAPHTPQPQLARIAPCASDALSGSLPPPESLRFRTHPSRDVTEQRSAVATLSSLSSCPGSWIAPVPRARSMAAADNPLSGPTLAPQVSDKHTPHCATANSNYEPDPSYNGDNQAGTMQPVQCSVSQSARWSGPHGASATMPQSPVAPACSGCQRFLSRLCTCFAPKPNGGGRERSSRQQHLITVDTMPPQASAAQVPKPACLDEHSSLEVRVASNCHLTSAVAAISSLRSLCRSVAGPVVPVAMRCVAILTACAPFAG